MFSCSLTPEFCYEFSTCLGGVIKSGVAHAYPFFQAKFAVCKIVQRGNLAGILDYEKVSLLLPQHKGRPIKVLDVKAIDHRVVQLEG